ncbi:MAG TPA: ABC transporter ATP-binding protein [bacterium]|mgnify:FL=1|nr:ABC transporter ATP-binding protein [bacterium]
MILIQDLSHRIGAFHLDGISLEIPTGRYAVLMGKTGSGKTTLLEILCGLKPVQSGRIFLMERDVTFLKPAHRGIGYVPQDGALFPSMTVHDHLAFALRVRKWDTAAIEKRVGELAGVLGITHLLGRRPQGLSGGEAQRAALGRALAFHPRVLLLDEPLSALDEETRRDMYQLILSVRRQYNITALHVTHNWQEAITLGDCVFILKDGRIAPCGPHDIPASRNNMCGSPADYGTPPFSPVGPPLEKDR